MGVVRREGNWRLHKRAEGVYEITHQDRIELKAVTADYQPMGIGDARDDISVPVREVESFSDVETIFEQMAAERSSAGGFGSAPSVPEGGLDAGGDAANLEDLPPGGLLLVGAIGGGIFLSTTGLDLGNPVFLLGVGFLLMAATVLGFTYLEYRRTGPRAAYAFLVSSETGDEAESSTRDDGDGSPEKTPPAPQSLRNELFFERADQQCEWCDNHVDNPEVHHIEPRSEGGPNDPENLIVLCPNCHTKADNEAIPRSKLQYKVDKQMENWAWDD